MPTKQSRQGPPSGSLRLWLAMTGRNGYINEPLTGHSLRDAKLYKIGAGASEIRGILMSHELYEELR